MKKIVLSLAGVLAATAFAPEASAIPAFARQTGMACNACHQQHFPILNGFGRAFKAAGYTMMGAQGKVEGEHLSIPDTLNAAILFKFRSQRQSGNAGGINDGNGQTTGGTQWQMGDEFSLFFGGRMAENIGFMMENNVANVGGLGNLVAGFKAPIMFDMGNAKVGVTPFTTDALGVQYGYELGSTGSMRANRWAEMRRDISAVQYAIADGNGNNYSGTASGFAITAQSDMGYINYTRWTPNFAPGANGGAVPSFDMKSNYLRIVATPTVGDWAMHGGIGLMSGTSEVGITGGVYGANVGAAAAVANVVALAGGAALTPAQIAAAGAGANAGSALVATKATFADFQAHGEVGGKELGVYASYANAPKSAANCVASNSQGACNLYNSSLFVNRTAWAIGADYSVIPHTLHVGASYRTATRAGNNGVAANNGQVSVKDNSLGLYIVYDLAQNVALHANFAARSGSRYDAFNTNGANKNEQLYMLEAAW